MMEKSLEPCDPGARRFVLKRNEENQMLRCGSVAVVACVHPGVTIGEGAVIGARSVVTKDMPEWTVCAGFPCVPIKERKRTDA